jgi:hypothetical protein
VLHGEQRRRGAARDADLAVGVLDVAVGGLDRDPERTGDLLGLQSPCQQGDHLGLAVAQPGRALEPRGALSGGLDDCRHRVGVQPSRPCLSGQLLRRVRRRQGRAMRARLGHRVVGVGRREHARGQRQLRPG